MSHSLLREVAPAVHVATAPQRFYGLDVGARMTVLALAGGLLVHSPIAFDPTAVTRFGDARWVLAPNLFHHLHLGGWAHAGLELWGARGLPDKRPDLRFAGVVEPGASPFGDEVQVLPLASLPFSNEVVVLHRPIRTLIVTDLVFHFTASAPWTTRAVMQCLGGHPGRTTVLERLGMRREVARREPATLAAWDFDRQIMAHGAILETGGKAALLAAFDWLSTSTLRLSG